MAATASDETETILYEKSDGIAVITLNRPDKLNALLPGMSEQYADLLRAADDDPDVRVIVVTGAGRGFCSGADLAALAQGPEDLIASFVEGQSVDTLPTTAFRIGTPVVTAINGACAGIGFVLALCADVRFAAPTANFSVTFPRLGLIAEYGATWFLTRLIGVTNATDLLLTGRRIDADEALRLGLVNEVVDDPLARAMEWARDVAANCSPTSTAIIKRQLLVADGQDLEEAVTMSLAEMRPAFRRPDLPEAMAARAEKRQVNFAPRATV